MPPCLVSRTANFLPLHVHTSNSTVTAHAPLPPSALVSAQSSLQICELSPSSEQVPSERVLEVLWIRPWCRILGRIWDLYTQYGLLVDCERLGDFVYFLPFWVFVRAPVRRSVQQPAD